MAIKKTGYLYVYLSNESGQDVLFDNLKVNHISGPVIEETHYYPFGLEMAGISNKALKGLLYPQNKNKYNGIEFNGDFDINEYEANYRTLDPQIGRWGQIDPKIGSFANWSPYVGMSDNPILNSDFLGDSTINPNSYQVNSPNSSILKRPLDYGRDKNGIITQPSYIMSKVDPLGYAYEETWFGLESAIGFNYIDNFIAGLFSPQKKDPVEIGIQLLNIGVILSGERAGATPTALDGSFSITSLGRKNYPNHPEVPFPEGPFRILKGEEYITARKSADAANKKIHSNNPHLDNFQIHEIHPVKMGGHPTNILNKVPLAPADHRPFTNWWETLKREVQPFNNF